MNDIFIRRSIRLWQNKPVEKEKIETLLRAAMQAPSARNGRPWEFLVAQAKPLLSSLSEVSPWSVHCAKASLVIAVIGKAPGEASSSFWQQDCAAATQNILLQCVSLGLGGVWIGIAPIQERIDNCQKILNLPEGRQVLSLVALGYPAEGQAHRFIDRYEAENVHWEVY